MAEPGPVAGNSAASASRDGAPSPSGSRTRVAVVWVAGLLPAICAVIAIMSAGSTPYLQVASDYPGPATALASATGRALLVVASTLCVGALVTAVLLVPRVGRDRLLVEDFGLMTVVRGAGVVWAGLGSALVLVDAADSNGQPVGRLFEPGGLILVREGYLARAWMVTVLCVLAVVTVASLSRSWSTMVTSLGVAAVAVLAPVLVAHVLVGPDHDYASDAAVLGTPAAAAWFGSTAVLFVFRRRVTFSATLERRYLRLASLCWLVVTASAVVVALVETRGGTAWNSATGRLFVVQFLVLAALAALGRRWWRTACTGCDPQRTDRFLVVATLLVAVHVAADVVLTRIPPPHFFAPTSIAQNFLGYDVPDAPGLVTLALRWRVNLLFVVIAAVAVSVYLAGLRRLAPGHRAWPRARTAAWVGGWLLVVVTTSSGVGRYAGASFSVHMLLHMSLNMAAPALLVLGAPVELALTATRRRPLTQPAGVHEGVTAMVHSGLVRRLSQPMHALVAYTASYYLLYFTDVFNQASRYHWAHVLMNLEFLLVGYVFFRAIIGVDRLTPAVPSLAKLGLVLAGMPFHAFFGVLVMTSHHLIAGTFYRYLQPDVPWMTDLGHDQYVGGGIALVTGEVPLTFALVVLLVRWARHDDRWARHDEEATSARRRSVDAELDGHDAYAELLARLRERRTHETEPARGTSSRGAVRGEGTAGGS